MAEWDGTNEYLAYGSTGQSVKELQQKLKNLGYDVGNVDGIFGAKTEAALKEFQRDAGISVDAIAGPQTYAALQTAVSKPKTQQTSNVPTTQTYSTSSGGSAQQKTTTTQTQQTATPQQTTTPSYSTGGGNASGIAGYTALVGQDLQKQIQQFSDLSKSAMAPYEELIRQYIGGQPSYTPRTDEELLALARQMAGLAVGPQRLAIQQQIEELQRQADMSRQRIEASYAGAEDALARALAIARQQATESAIARGGGRSGLVDYTTTKLQEPLMINYQQQQAQRAAALADIESALGLGQSQAAERLRQLAEQEGALTTQQLAALKDTDYARAQQAWQLGLQGALNLAGLAGQQNQYNMATAMNLLPYLYLTEAQRQSLPMDWASLVGQVPAYTPTPTQMPAADQAAGQQLVPVRAYAASKGKNVDWDEDRREVIIENVRIPIGDVQKLGGKVEDGTSYMPKSLLDSLLGVA